MRQRGKRPGAEFRQNCLDGSLKHKLFIHYSYLTIWSHKNREVINPPLTTNLLGFVVCKKKSIIIYIRPRCYIFCSQFAYFDIRSLNAELEEILMSLLSHVYNDIANVLSKEFNFVY